MKYFAIKNLNFDYDKKNILKDINISINKGDILAIVGKSGIGKTTLLKLIAGFEKEKNGDIYIDNKKINDIKVHKRNIGFIFQDYTLFPHKTVYNNIGYGIKNKKEKDNIINNFLKLIKMEDKKNKYPYELSGGEQQRVAIARTLATSPNILLMDEPFSNLDINLKKELIMDLKNIFKKLNMTVILVSHSIEDIKKLTNNIFYIT